MSTHNRDGEFDKAMTNPNDIVSEAANMVDRLIAELTRLRAENASLAERVEYWRNLAGEGRESLAQMSAVKPTAEVLLRRAMEVCHEVVMDADRGLTKHNAANLKNHIDHFLQAASLASHRQPESDRSNPWIVCAAVRYRDGFIVAGPRHMDYVMRPQIDANKRTASHHEAQQGFIDQHGKFHTRTEAWRIAQDNGQIRHRCGGDESNGGTLYSENLY